MQISPQAFKTITQGRLENGKLKAFWIEGKEPLLVEQSRNELIAYAKKTIETRKVEHVQANYDWGKLLAENTTMGLFDEGTIYDLRIDKINKKDLPYLATFIKNLADEEFLILSSEKLEKKFTQLKDFKALNESLGLITHWPLDIKSYPQWIEGYCQKIGLSIDVQARKWLASQYEGNLFALKQCLDRLWIFKQEAKTSLPLSIEALEQHTRYEAKFTLFETVDLAFASQHLKSLQALAQLKTQGEEPILLLWAIDNGIEALLEVQGLRAQHQNVNWPAFKVFGPRVTLMESAVKRIDRPTLKIAKRWCGLLDGAIKGLYKFDVWIGFEMLLSLLAKPDSGLRPLSESTLNLLQTNDL